MASGGQVKPKKKRFLGKKRGVRFEKKESRKKVRAAAGEEEDAKERTFAIAIGPGRRMSSSTGLCRIYQHGKRPKKP